MSLLPGSHFQPPALSSCSMTAKHHGKLTGARMCFTALSSEICPCLQLCSQRLPDTSGRGKSTLPQGQRQEQGQVSASCTSPAATVPAGGGSSVLFCFLHTWALKEKEQHIGEQGRTLPVVISILLLLLLLTVRLSHMVPTYFQFHRGEENALVISELWVSFPLGRRTEWLGPFPSLGYG